MTDKSVYAWICNWRDETLAPPAPMIEEKFLAGSIFTKGVSVAECFHHGWYATKMKPCLWPSELDKLMIKNTDTWFYERDIFKCCVQIS